jgi:hypothetical protein
MTNKAGEYTPFRDIFTIIKFILFILGLTLCIPLFYIFATINPAEFYFFGIEIKEKISSNLAEAQRIADKYKKNAK